MPVLSVTSGAVVAVPAGAKDVQNYGPGRVGGDGVNTVTWATSGFRLEVGSGYSPATNDADASLYLIAESTTSTVGYVI